jgi:hypothetical protein
LDNPNQGLVIINDNCINLFVISAIRDIIMCLIHVPKKNVPQIPGDEPLPVVRKFLLEVAGLDLLLYEIIHVVYPSVLPRGAACRFKAFRS